MQVGEIMTRQLEALDGSRSVGEVARKMRDLDVGALPVLEDGNIVGIVTDRDLVIRSLANGLDASERPAREVMTRNPVCCREHEEVEDAIRLMERYQVRRLPVMDEEENLIGILSLGDVAERASHALSGEALQAISRHDGPGDIVAA